ncbi:hypothetical protein Poli38472_001476 [Pythium oligandrum]|uniref:Uncharacterized protein n=1 Tax=Pythium oligandrum TaxID=41045 RepID=A0A8K1CV93_PYTOL|nr:hypothetical protein Poli38472_001476 [Pythium oligandrum]|eukprot:TMW69320.1 hypothetical protein Poli38472_001476 [Pythium oligandrum]
MGACGSKDIEAQRRKGGARDLSRWKAGDEAAEGGNEAASVETNVVEVDFDPRSPVNLVLNTVATLSTSTTECVTGWEDGSVRQIDWQSSRVVRTWQPHTRAVNRVVVGERHGKLYSSSRDTTIAVTTPVSAAETESASIKLQGHTLNVSAIAVDTDETSLCSGGRDTQTMFWDLTTAKIKSKNTTAQNVITCSKWVPTEHVVLQGSEDLSVKLWDERSALRTPVQTLRGYVYFPLCLDVSRDGLYFMTSSKGFNGVGAEVRVWDRRVGKQLLQFEGHQQDASACCFLPRGVLDSSEGEAPVPNASNGIPTPVSASKDGSIKVWNVNAENQLLCEANEPSGRMFTSLASTGDDGTVLAATFNGDLHAYVYDTKQRSIGLSKSWHQRE